jgi:hypothetical protein
MNVIENYYNEILIKISLITSFCFFATIIIALFYKKYFNLALKIFFNYLLIRVFLELITKLFIWSTAKHYEVFWKPILEYFQIYDINFINGIYYLVNFILIGYFYSKIFNFIKLKTISICLAIFQVINYFFIDGFRSYGTVGAILSDLFLIILPCMYLYRMSAQPPNIPVQKNSYFWISLGLFIPHLVQIAITITASDLHQTDFVFFCKTHVFRNIILIISQLFFIYAFLQSRYLKYL